MKTKLFIIPFLGIISVFVACNSAQKKSVTNDDSAVKPDSEIVVTDSLRFCESTYPYDGGLLIANFGTEELNPLNNERKGYILFYKDGSVSTYIPADGNLNAPKGMFETDGYLFICDVNKIVVYNLNDRTEKPQTIRFPEEDMFINDLAASGKDLYVSVTNTGKIYKIDISDLENLDKAKPGIWCNIPGPNGLVLNNDTMFIASYPPDGNTSVDNVVYVIPDIQNPVPEKLITEAGQYDGIALSPDRKTLYVTNWSPAGVYSIDLDTKQLSAVPMKTEVTGAADMTLKDGKLYIPDLANSCLIELILPE